MNDGNFLKSMQDRIAETQQKNPVVQGENVTESQTQVETPSETKAQEATQPAQAAEATEQAQQEATNKEVVSTSLFDFSFEKQKAEQTKPQTAEEFFTEVKKRYGERDPFGLFGDIEKLKEVEDKLQVVEVEKNTIEQFVTSLPPDIIDVVRAYHEGGDYRDTMKKVANSSMDYNRSANSYSREELIRMYNDDLSEEEMEDMDEKTKASMYRLAKDNYTMQQKQWVDKRDEYIKKQKSAAGEIIASANKSIQSLTTKFPDIKKSELKAVETILKHGAHTEFYDTNSGVYKDNAAERLLFGTHGLKIIEEMKGEFEKILKRESSKVRSETAEKIITEVTTDKIDRGSTQATTLNVGEYIQKRMPWLKTK